MGRFLVRIRCLECGWSDEKIVETFDSLEILWLGPPLHHHSDKWVKMQVSVENLDESIGGVFIENEGG